MHEGFLITVPVCRIRRIQASLTSSFAKACRDGLDSGYLLLLLQPVAAAAAEHPTSVFRYGRP